MVSAAIFGEKGDGDNNLMGEGGYDCTFNITNYKNGGGKTNLMPSPHLPNHAYRQHVMLLYDSDDERKATVIDYMNEGLKNGHLCIYASVGAYDSASKWHYSNLSSKIENFEKNVKQGNLVIIDFKPFFEAARKGDPTIFNQLKSQLETMRKQRIVEGKSDKILAFTDAACTLSENKEFEECIELESWWHSAHQEWIKRSQNITVIHPHPAAAFDEGKATVHAKAQIAAVHSVMLEASQCNYYQEQHQQTAAAAIVARPIRILIAEPEEDIQLMYRTCLDLLALEVIIVPDAAKCFEHVFDSRDNKGFDIVILDTHLKDISGIIVARQIKQRLPDQRIIITTTTVPADEIEGVGVSRDDIIYKPFSSCKLLGLIKPEK
jgi:CheY-like chemotaxis protein